MTHLGKPSKLICAALFALIAVCQLSGAASAVVIAPMESFQRGESVKLPTLNTLDGKKLDYAVVSKNKVVIFAFWLHTCDACVKNIQALGDYLCANGRSKDVVLLTVTRGNTKIEKTLIKAAVAKWRRKYPVILDPDMLLSRAFDAYQAPSFVAIGKDGKVKTPVMFFIDEKIRDINFKDMTSMLIKGASIPEIQFIDYTPVTKFRKMIGKPAPDFNLASIDHKDYKLSNYKNKMNVILVFWHPYCEYCKNQMTQIVKYYGNEQLNNNYVVLTVSSIYGYDQEDAANKFLSESGAMYPILSDQDSKIGKLYGVNKIPTLFFIDKTGKVFDVVEGQIKNIPGLFNPVLAAMSGKK